MSLLTTLLFWAPVAFAFVVATSYVGTMLALRSYHDGENPRLTEAFGVEDRRD